VRSSSRRNGLLAFSDFVTGDLEKLGYELSEVRDCEEDVFSLANEGASSDGTYARPTRLSGYSRRSLEAMR
jgi:hypothetical protein